MWEFLEIGVALEFPRKSFWSPKKNSFLDLNIYLLHCSIRLDGYFGSLSKFDECNLAIFPLNP